MASQLKTQKTKASQLKAQIVDSQWVDLGWPHLLPNSRQTTSSSLDGKGQLCSLNSFDADSIEVCKCRDTCSPGGRCWPPLITAVQRRDAESVAFLLGAGENPNSKEPSSGWTPLMYAASAGNCDFLRELIQAGADVNFLAQPFDWTALTVAIMANQEEAVGLLLDAGADLCFLRRRHPDLAETYQAALKCDEDRRFACRQQVEKPCCWVKDYWLYQ